MIIKVLGSGCSKCKKLEENVHKALAEKGITVVNVGQSPSADKAQVTVIKVTDLKAIMAYGVMTTPALVIDEKVVSTGKLLSPSDIMKFLG